MRNQLVNGIISIITKYIGAGEHLNRISDEVALLANEFEVTRRETALAEIDYFPHCVIEYIATRKVEGYSIETLKNYNIQLQRFFRVVRRPINEVTKADVIGFINGLDVADSSKDGYLTIIKTFFAWALDEGYIDRNPCKNIRKIKFEEKLPVHLNDLELEMLRGACKTPKESAMVEFFYSTGCRVQEVINTNISDIDFAKGELVVLGKGNKHREVYLNPRCIVAIRRYLNTRIDSCDALFVKDRGSTRITSRKSYENIFADLGVRAGITKHVHPHLLRHTMATLAVERNARIEVVQKLLGHSNINTTMIYAEVQKANIKNNHRVCVV